MHYKQSADMRRFNQLMAETNGVYHAMAQSLGLSDSAFTILYTLSLLETPAPLSRVVQLTGLPKQTVNSALRKLDKDGLLTLEAAGARKKNLFLTPAGQILCQEKIHPVLALEDEIFHTWTQEERELYLRLTQRYLDDLKEKSRERLGGCHG